MNNEDRMFHISQQLDADTIREFERNVPTSVCRSIASDHIGKPTSFPMVPSETRGRTGANFADEVPITPPPGIKIMDAMMAQDDRLWRRDLAQRLGVRDEPKDAA
jgi:hypothetical protein